MFFVALFSERQEINVILFTQTPEGQKSISIWGVVYESNITPVVVANFLQEVIFEPEKKVNSQKTHFVKTMVNLTVIMI